MKKSDKIETKAKIQLGSVRDPTWLEVYEGVFTNKALLKHIIDNDLRHIWRVITIILSYLIAGTVGFLLKSLGIL